MSTEHQRYSTQNQADAIAQYAAQNGLILVRSYEDVGKSGLRIKGRDALKRLITDIQSGEANFDTVLVYDVSRWGRFQDADEGAHYEFVCKQAGITVQYCAEQFRNDGSLSATIIKGMKRAMAGEFSRELSRKVFSGACRIASLGFHQGGPPGYGLRRQLLDENGNPKGELERGQRKNLQSDRVILIPGPKHEVDAIREIYRLFTQERQSDAEIADLLNSRRIQFKLGRPWTGWHIHRVLTNEKYIGNVVYNRISFKLKQKRVRNPRSLWVRSEGAFEAIVDPDTFETAAKIIADRRRPSSDAEMLEKLATLLKRKGWLSAHLIDAASGVPCTTSYLERFGTLITAYRLIGYHIKHSHRNQSANSAPRSIVPEITSAVIHGVENLGGDVRVCADSDLLEINGEFTVSIVIACCMRIASGLRWKIRLTSVVRPDITIAVRLREGNRHVLDYFLLPSIDLEPQMLRLCMDNGSAIDRYRSESLDPLFALCARQSVGVIVDDLSKPSPHPTPDGVLADACEPVSQNRLWSCAML